MSSRPCPTACVMRASPWSLRSHVAVSGPRPNTLRIREQILASNIQHETKEFGGFVFLSGLGCSHALLSRHEKDIRIC